MNSLSGLKLPLFAPGYISWLEATAGTPATEEERSVAEDITELINSAYIDGVAGRAGYLQDPEAGIAVYAADQGEEPTNRAKETITRITRLRNLVYQEGRRVAEKEAEAKRVKKRLMERDATGWYGYLLRWLERNSGNMQQLGIVGRFVYELEGGGGHGG